MRRALILMTLVVACQSGPAPTPAVSPTPAAVKGGTLVMADFEFPDTLDPLHATTEADLRLAGLLFEPLWTFGPDLEPVPRLLAAMPVPKEGKDGTMTLDLKLRPGLEWSDGTPLTADDVISTVNSFASGAHIASQERRSATEVVWHFSSVEPAWQLIGPRAIPFRADRPDVFSGPFVVKGVVPGQLIELANNPRYAAGRPRGAWLDGITYRAYVGKAGLITGLQTGEVDLGFHLLPSDLPQLAGIARSQSVITPTLRGEFLVPNHQSAVWAADPTLLKVLSGSLDRVALNKAAFDGFATPSEGLFPPQLKRYDAGPPPSLSPAQAKAALAGRKPAFSLLTICDDQVRQVEQAELVRQWSLLGASSSSDCEPRATFFTRLAKGTFDMALFSNTWQPDPSAWASLADFGRCHDARLDQDFASGGSTLNAKIRETAYRDAATEWAAAECAIPLLQWPAVVQGSTRLHGFEPNPVAGFDSWNAADWWLGS